MQSSIRLLIGAAALSSALVSPPAWGDHVYVRVAPPVPIVEVRPPMPSHRHVWVGGHHSWNGSSYAWVRGSWRRPPHRHHTRWVSGRWHHHHRHGYYWVDGHWR